MSFVPLDKQSKKQQKAFYSKQRISNGFNTGTRIMKNAKKPTRAMLKDRMRKNKEI